MMRFSDLLAKIANQARLTPQELDQLKIYGNETEQRNSFIAGNTSAQGTLNIKFPFVSIYSQVIAVDTAVISIKIPSDYNHLMIICNGRSTDAGTGIDALTAQFNKDTGSNYAYQYLLGTGSTASASQGATRTQADIGSVIKGGTSAGQSVSSFAILPNYKGSFHKQILFMDGRMVVGDTGYVGIESSVWASVSAIQSMDVFVVGDSIAAGTFLSIYGIL